ncbi:hypothetical protein EDB81DRAFT_666793 [Dactylonectria macrodidyma]|uniref:Uncharacterized protein n=1 Tax=Dactylonectria macrodidyma TaxID=307937 RepID=A0A9P9IFX9_9HYPO|nr:hypothetical protein EDB81DRAFT_666793 [Dactylonectria macrodidyma]
MLFRIVVVSVLFYFLLSLSNAKALLESTPDVPAQPGQHKPVESKAPPPPPNKSKPVGQNEQSEKHGQAGQAGQTRTEYAIVPTTKAALAPQSQKTKQPEKIENPKQPVPPVQSETPEQPPKKHPKLPPLLQPGKSGKEQPRFPENLDRPGHKNQRLVVLLPATGPNPDLCKFLFSAMILGYPTPIVITWGADYREVTPSPIGWNMLKIVGVANYLDAALNANAHPDERLDKDDLVLIADGYDVWFQLTPDVLLKRYHEGNARANARLREEWPHQSPMPMKQTIMAASGKNCFPRFDTNITMRCNLMPESPERIDLYGAATDDNHNMTDFHTMRPKYINGGTYIGPAGDLRNLFRRTSSKLQSGAGRGEELWSEQGMTGEVLGEQELWRKWRRRYDDSGADGNDTDALSIMNRDYEYHFGLDYRQEISVPTSHAEKDGWIVRLNNKADIGARSTKLGIDPVRLRGVPADIKASSNPLKKIVPSADWGEMPMYADFWTENVPVLLHHNARAHGLKGRRTWWWADMWYFKYLRQLVTIGLAPKELTPLGEVKLESTNVTYWAPPLDRVRRRPRFFRKSLVQPMVEMEYDHVCRFEEEPEDPEGPQNWWDEVLRDGKGGIE